MTLFQAIKESYIKGGGYIKRSVWKTDQYWYYSTKDEKIHSLKLDPYSDTVVPFFNIVLNMNRKDFVYVERFGGEDFIQTPNRKFFDWIYDRLLYVYKEDPNIDFMISLRQRIDKLFPEE